jgi:hypothetical protein
MWGNKTAPLVTKNFSSTAGSKRRLLHCAIGTPAGMRSETS